MLRLALFAGLTACAAPQRPPDPPKSPPSPEAKAEPAPPPRAAPAAGGQAPHARTRHGTPAEIDLCIAETNRYRARAKRPPYARSPGLDAFAAAGAEADFRARTPHHHFNTSTYPEPFSGLGENELPWWRLDPKGGVALVLQAGLASMWEEGPGGGHYENIVGSFTEMGCGIFIDGDQITVTQDFRSP